MIILRIEQLTPGEWHVTREGKTVRRKYLNVTMMLAFTDADEAARHLLLIQRNPELIIDQNAPSPQSSGSPE